MINKLGQVIKSIGRMPWHQEPMKDGISTEMLRGVANRLWSGDVRMGKPTWATLKYSLLNKIGKERYTRGTETSKYPEEEKEKFDFHSSGERTGKSPNQIYLGLRAQHKLKEFIAEEGWEASPKKVIVL